MAPALNRLKPYRTAGGRFYIRVGKDKKDATGRELVRIAEAAGELHYDESPVLGASLADLSLPVFEAYHYSQYGLALEAQLAQSGVTLTTLLRNLRLLHELDGEQVLSVTALLVFGEAPQRFMPQSRLSAVAFAGNDEDSDILDRREITGRLPQIIDETRLFLERNIRARRGARLWSRRPVVIRPQGVRRGRGQRGGPSRIIVSAARKFACSCSVIASRCVVPAGCPTQSRWKTSGWAYTPSATRPSRPS